jgi:hypothetical protein
MRARLLRTAARAALAAAVVAAWPALAQPRVANEAELKAAIAYRIALFVEWPADSLPSGAPLQVCVAGSDATWAAAFATIEGKKVQGHALAPTRMLARGEEPRGCHLLFVPERELRRPAAGAPGLLTIGEAEGFAASGGVVGFVREGAQLRFDINRDAAARAQLRLPTELLKVARQVIAPEGARP